MDVGTLVGVLGIFIMLLLYGVERRKRKREERVRRGEQDRAIGAMRRIERIVQGARDSYRPPIITQGYGGGAKASLSHALEEIEEVVTWYMDE